MYTFIMPLPMPGTPPLATSRRSLCASRSTVLALRDQPYI
jgi:hypothetical protein